MELQFALAKGQETTVTACMNVETYRYIYNHIGYLAASSMEDQLIQLW